MGLEAFKSYLACSGFWSSFYTSYPCVSELNPSEEMKRIIVLGVRQLGGDFNMITPFTTQKRQEGGVIRGRRQQGMTTTALWGGRKPCPRQ